MFVNEMSEQGYLVVRGSLVQKLRAYCSSTPLDPFGQVSGLSLPGPSHLGLRTLEESLL